MAEEKVLEVKNLHVNFHTYAGDVKAIRNVSFDLEKGQTPVHYENLLPTAPPCAAAL